MAELAKQLSERLRPRRLDDLALPQRDIDRLRRMAERGTIMNMLFYSAPGLGKTSAGRILINMLGPDTSMEIDGSSATGVDYVRDHIERFAWSFSIHVGQKICFIDEAEYVSKSAQGALRKLIEESASNCRFILAVNDVSKIIPALRSRLMEICFDIAPADRHEVIARLNERYKQALSELGVTFDDGRMIQLIAIHYPDLRAIANHVEYEFVS